MRSENGPHGATKKEYEKAKVSMNQFLAADIHVKPARSESAQSRDRDTAVDSITGSNMLMENPPAVTVFVNAYPVAETSKNKWVVGYSKDNVAI